MSILKKLLKALGVLVILLVLFILIVLLVDRQSTAYLKVSKLENLENSYLITNVQIVPMTQDTILRNQSIFIENGRIAKIGSQLDSTDLLVINGNGHYVMPGLSDMHVHVWDNYELGLYVSNGVTSVRNLWGQPHHLRMKREIADDQIIAPLFFTSGPKLTGPEHIGDDNYQLFSVSDAREMVHYTKEKGYDFIKTYYNLPQDFFDAILEEAAKENLDIVAHPSQKVSYENHFQTQIKSVEHAEDIVQQPLNYSLDTLKLNQVVQGLGRTQATAFCPTLTVYHNILRMLVNDSILNDPSLDCMNPLIRKVDSQAQFDRWSNAKHEDPSVKERIQDQHEFHLLAIRKLHEAGVTIICGTDAGIGITVPGASIHEELAFYREAGLSNFEVLKTATVNPSNTHDFMSDIGTVEVGKLANLLLLETNPLDDLETLKNPELVFIKGRVLDRPTMDIFKKKGANRGNLLASIFRYAEFLITK